MDERGGQKKKLTAATSGSSDISSRQLLEILKIQHPRSKDISCTVTRHLLRGKKKVQLRHKARIYTLTFRKFVRFFLPL